MTDSKASVELREVAPTHAPADENPQPDMTPWQCLKQNPKVVALIFYANLGALMIGYDNLSLSVCLAMPAFQMKFGDVINGSLIIPAYWQSLWNALYNATTMLGSFAGGFLQDRFGRRVSFLLTVLLSSAGIAINFTAETRGIFLAGKILTGFSIGLILSGAQTYISEITPLPIRGMALSVYAIFMNLGMLIAISSTFGRISIIDPMAFRLIFAVAWIFPGLLLLGLPFMPESPYWLVLQNKNEKAERMLRRLRSSTADIQSEMAQIIATAEAERNLRTEIENVSFLECFKGTNWRRTRIMIICNYMPQVIGATVSANAPYFLTQTGMASDKVIALVQAGVSFGVASAILNVALMTKFNYRHLMFSGVTLCSVLFLIMGIAGCFPHSKSGVWVVGISLQITPWSYGMAIGASMALAGEVSAVRLRAKSQSIGIAFNYLFSTIWLIVLPYLFNADEANLGGKLGFIWSGMGLIMLVVVFFDVPETKGFTFEELDEMFERRIPARQFKSYKAVLTQADAKVV